MTPEEFLNTVNSYTNDSKQEAKELFPAVVSKFEERLFEHNKNRETINPYVTLSEKQFGTSNPYTVMALTELLKEYLIKQGWLVSVQYPEAYLFDVSTRFRLFTPSRKHSFYVWILDTFKPTISVTGY
jgi:hypothetical protein